jgi:hypothetical protein
MRRRVAKRESAQLLGPTGEEASPNNSGRMLREKPSRGSFAASGTAPNFMNGYWRRISVSVKDSGVLSIMNEVRDVAYSVRDVP